MNNQISLVVSLFQKFKIGSVLFGLMVFNYLSLYAQIDNNSYGKVSLYESVLPVRPGIPDVQPFWNGYSHRFIYAPAFDYAQIDGASKYRFEIVSSVDSSKYNFESSVPFAPLSPIWASIPVGFFDLMVTGISSNGEKVGLSGQGRYYRAAYFDGVYHTPKYPYDKSAKIALDNLLDKDYVKYWITNKKPDPDYDYYRYPAKIMSALIIGTVTQARLKSSTSDASRYIKLARTVADYLIGISFEKGTPLEYFPPTYKDYETVFKKKTPHIDTNNEMIISAADGGNAYLDLYDLTSDTVYLEAAKRIAETYVKTQLENGSWYMYINVNTGKEAAPNIAIPTSTINYLDRLARDYQVSGLEETKSKALKWIMDNPMVSYDWQAQFEDIFVRDPYSNQSREQVCDMAIYLLNNCRENPQNLMLAEDLIRFAEDQFVIWEKPAVLEKKSKGPAWEAQNWISPSVQEQYTFFQPVGRAAGIMMETYRRAYNVTKKDIYLAKAISIANTFTVVQSEHNGDYPTLFSKYKSNFWLNSVVYPAKMMINLENELNQNEQ